MKKFYFICLLLLLLSLSNQSYSQLAYGWSEQNSGFTGTLWSVSAVDSNVVWVGGDSLKVLRTTNGGINWTVIPISQSISRVIYPIYNIFAIDANTAICTGSSNTYTSVFRTSNGGVSWSTVFMQIGGFMDCITMFTNTNGFMNGDPVGGRFSLWKTSDGGSNWDSAGLYLSAASNEYGNINSLCVDGGKIWFGTYFGTCHSTNYGNNWVKLLSPSPANSIWSNNSASGFIMLGSDNLYSSKNSGSNWIQVSGVPGSGWLCGITGTGSEWWFIRFGLSVYYSSNNGSSWITQYTTASKEFNHISIARTGKYIWGVRDAGGISRYGLISGISTISQNVPSEFKLYQNYPNPFNPETKIKFDIKKKSFAEIKIFNISGKEISTLVNNNLNPGSYSVDFDASALPSGIYFCVLKTDYYTNTKRMVFIK